MEDINPVIYIFMNKSLGMSAGKLAAQAAHAAMMIGIHENVDKLSRWTTAPHRTMLIMEARDEAHLRNIEQYLKERGIYTEKIIDEGVNEIEAHTITALATRVLPKDDPDVVKALSTFKLYRDKVRVTLEIDK